MTLLALDAPLTRAKQAHALGLRRTNEDKRKAVLTLLNDAEWAKWSNGHPHNLRVSKMKKTIELKVSKSVGRYWNLERRTKPGLYKEYKGDLFANPNGLSFYRAVAAKIAWLAARGYSIKYKDISN